MTGYAIPKSKWPKWLRKYKIVKGISVKGCREGCAWREGIMGHAHSDPKSKYHGWICFRHASCVRSGKIIRHELAHLLSPLRSVHDKIWRDNLIAIGGTLKSFPVWVGNKRYTTPAYKKKKHRNQWAPAPRSKKRAK